MRFGRTARRRIIALQLLLTVRWRGRRLSVRFLLDLDALLALRRVEYIWRYEFKMQMQTVFKWMMIMNDFLQIKVGWLPVTWYLWDVPTNQDSHSPNSNSRSGIPTMTPSTTNRRHRRHSGSGWCPARVSASARRTLAAAFDADAADASPHKWGIVDANGAQSTPSRSWCKCVFIFILGHSTECRSRVHKYCFYDELRTGESNERYERDVHVGSRIMNIRIVLSES